MNGKEERLAAEAGANMLDARWPGWANHVSNNKLDMRGENSGCGSCVLEQLEGSYLKGLKILFGNDTLVDLSEQNGFHIWYGGDWEELTLAWKAEVRKRTGMRPRQPKELSSGDPESQMWQTKDPQGQTLHPGDYGPA